MFEDGEQLLKLELEKPTILESEREILDLFYAQTSLNLQIKIVNVNINEESGTDLSLIQRLGSHVLVFVIYIIDKNKTKSP